MATKIQPIRRDFVFNPPKRIDEFDVSQATATGNPRPQDAPYVYLIAHFSDGGTRRFPAVPSGFPGEYRGFWNVDKEGTVIAVQFRGRPPQTVDARGVPINMRCFFKDTISTTYTFLHYGN